MMTSHEIDTATVERTTSNRPNGANWLIGVSLAVIAVCMLQRLGEPSSPAVAQTMQQAGARGIFAFTGELGKDTHGLFMIDVDEMTLWCYEYDPGVGKLRLVASRSWMFDRYLKDFNCAGPTPEEVENQVQMERDAILQRSVK